MGSEQNISDEAAWAFDESASAHRKKHGGTFRHCCTRAGVEAAYSLLRKQWEEEYPRHDQETRFVHRVTGRKTRTLIWPEDGDGSEWRTEVRDILVSGWRPADV